MKKYFDNRHVIALLVMTVMGCPVAVNAQQMRVLFSDELESRALTVKVKEEARSAFGPQGSRYATMKMGTIRIVNFRKNTDLDTLSFSQRKTKAPLMAIFDDQHSLMGKGSRTVLTEAEFSVAENISFDLTGQPDFNTSVSATRMSVKRIREAVSHVGSFVSSDIFPDTSYVESWINLNDHSAPYMAVIVFQGDEAPKISGIAVYGSDTLTIRSVHKEKKYRASGVELVHLNRVIAGLQLPDMHIGPSFILVDKDLPVLLNKISYSLLSLILYVNENRQ